MGFMLGAHPAALASMKLEQAIATPFIAVARDALEVVGAGAVATVGRGIERFLNTVTGGDIQTSAQQGAMTAATTNSQRQHIIRGRDFQTPVY